MDFFALGNADKDLCHAIFTEPVREAAVQVVGGILNCQGKLITDLTGIVARTIQLRLNIFPGKSSFNKIIRHLQIELIKCGQILLVLLQGLIEQAGMGGFLKAGSGRISGGVGGDRGGFGPIKNPPGGPGG